MATTFTQTGGARISSLFNATWPFAIFEVTDLELRLKCFWKCWAFPKNQITRLSEHRSFSTGLRIQHGVESYTPLIVFWTFAYHKLKRALEERGYTVYDHAANHSLQRNRHSVMVCNRCVPCAGSLSLGRC